MIDDEAKTVAGCVQLDPSALLGSRISFSPGGGPEVLALDSNGDIYIRGVLVTNDRDIVLGLRALLSGGTPHCASCTCGRRMPVHADDRDRHGRLRPLAEKGVVPGTIDWSEHELACREYARRYGSLKSLDRIATHGFGYLHLCDLLGREPETWRPS